MDNAQREVTELLDTRPELADDLRALLELNERQETWTFDDTPLDSGDFGELVSRGIVTESDAKKGYEIAHPRALRIVLGDGDIRSDADTTDRTGIRDRLTNIRRSRRASQLGFLLAGIAIVVAFRVFVYPSVFRGEHVVLLGNDPYFYRDLVFSMLDSGASITNVPPAIERGEPLLVSILVAVTRAFGGGTDVAADVLAWYPIGAAIISTVACYHLAVTLSQDRRAGVAAVAILAVLPAHAYRTALGYADHHALDFLWLAVAVVAAVRLLPIEVVHKDSRTWSTQLPWGVLLAVAVAGQAYSWNAAPLLITPFVVYSVIRSATLVHTGASPYEDIPLVLSIGGGGLLAGVGHITLGWQSEVIVGAPILAAIGMAVGLAVAAGVNRYSLPAWTAALFTTLAGIGVFAAAATIEPSLSTELQQELSRLVGMSGSSIAETQSLFSANYGLFVGPIFLYGTALVFALPAGAWAFYAGSTRPRWLLTASFGLVLFALSVAQVRFTGELSLFVAVFAGFAFVYFLDVVDITDRPHVFGTANTQPESNDKPVRSVSIPERRTLLSLSLAFLLVSGLGVIMTPLRTNTLVISESDYAAATWMEDNIESSGWTEDQAYVFSRWDTNRMHNAFVSGKSRSYGYAQTNYQSFIASLNSSQWYERLRGRAAFIVTHNSSVDNSNTTPTMGMRLAEWGRGLKHYRAVWASKNSKTKVYTLVAGASITGTTKPNTTVTVTHRGNVSGHEFTYKQSVTTSANGTYEATVPYTGTYMINGANLTVPDGAVRNGTQINVSQTKALPH